MRRKLAGLMALAVLSTALPAFAADSDSGQKSDIIGDLLTNALTGTMPGTLDSKFRATLYHAGAKGIRALDSLGCKVVAMRTVAVDKTVIPRRTVLFIKETVGLPMPDGGVHDGYWYASDIGGAIKGNKIDLFSGDGKSSMKPLMNLNLAQLTVAKAGEFKGCPPG
jgi:3D (Asp-Asp-Asp) domain-containing protein